MWHHHTPATHEDPAETLHEVESLTVVRVYDDEGDEVADTAGVFDLVFAELEGGP